MCFIIIYTHNYYTEDHVNDYRNKKEKIQFRRAECELCVVICMELSYFSYLFT